MLEHSRCPWGFGHWSSQAIPQMFSVPTLMVFLNYGSLLPLFCLGQKGSPKAVDPEPKDQATLLLLQVSAVSPMGQEWHLVPDLEPSDSSLPTRGEDVLSLTLSSSGFSCSPAQRPYPISSVRFEECFTR